MNQHERRNKITNRWVRMRGHVALVLVSETRLGPTVLCRKFAPFTAITGLIADALAAEQARASAPRNGTSPRKPDGQGEPTAATLCAKTLLPEPRTTLQRNPTYRIRDDISDDQGDYRYTHIPERSWKRYRAKQWHGGNRWSTRHEALAVAAW